MGDSVKNNTYEVYYAKGELIASLPDKGRTSERRPSPPDLAWAVAGDENGALRIWDLAKKERLRRRLAAVRQRLRRHRA